MQFMVLGYDGTDDKAGVRRAAVLDTHLRQAENWYLQGRWKYAAGILDDEERVIGSMIVCDFSSRQELDEKWLNHEPYVTGDVWKKIEISPVQSAPFLNC